MTGPDGAVVVDAGMRAWYDACRCCMEDVHPALVAQLDAERDAAGQPRSAEGICEKAEAERP